MDGDQGKPAEEPTAPPTASASDGGTLADRFLTALITTAEARGIRAVATALQPPLAVIALPDHSAGVVLYDRGQATPEELQAELDRLLSGQAAGVLYLVVVGGDARDLPILRLADSRAPDPKRLGVYQLSAQGELTSVAGRRLALLAEAAAALPSVHRPLSREELVAGVRRAQQAQDEAMAFATALEKRPQTATRVLGAACLAYFALAVYWGNQSSFTEALILMGANGSDLVAAGQWWRLLSYAFLHGGVAHLLMNMIALWSFGTFLEGLLGWQRYVLLYGLSALAGGIGSAVVAGVELSVGASGAIWGMMAAGLALVRRGHTPLPEMMAARLRPRLMSVLAINVGFSMLPLLLPGMPRLDLWAHAAGGAVGFLLVASGLLTRGLGPVAREGAPHRDPRLIRVAAIMITILMGGSVALALATGRPWTPLGLYQAILGG